MMSTNTISGWWSAILESASNPSSRKDLAAFLGKQRFCGSPDRFAVVDHQDFQSREFRLAVCNRALHETAFGALGYAFVGAGILWLFNISGARKPRYGVDIWRQ